MVVASFLVRKSLLRWGILEEGWGSAMFFFEASEKKFEIHLNGGQESLRGRGLSFWRPVVEMAGANILSKISNDHITAYLLSESCLLVWDQRALMITCGQTRLVDSLHFLLDKVGVESIDTLLYQRKNELRAKEQPSNFLEDVERLQAMIPGKAMRFGEAHGHHNLLFHSARGQAAAGDRTLELLMYDISPESSDFLITRGESLEEVKSFFNMEQIFVGYQVDAYAFKPCGASFNAIKDGLYYTIHITPEKEYSYVSIETNDCDGNNEIIFSFLKCLEPDSFDVISFNAKDDFCLPFYDCKSCFKETTSIGYEVFFAHYFKRLIRVEPPHYF